jgi:uncharacterized membrane protein
VHDEDVAKPLRQVVHHDWEHSTPVDLSDEGLLADLKDYLIDLEDAVVAVKDGKGKVKLHQMYNLDCEPAL